VLRQVGKQYSKVEANFLGRIMEPICEFYIIYLTIMVCITTHQQEVDLFTAKRKKLIYKKRKGASTERDCKWEYLLH
jgi:hypothetical protein